MEHKIRVCELDLMRFLAAVAVLLFHAIEPEDLGDTAYRVSRYGYLGVELFFAISGFVILWTASGRTWVQFLASRISRLYPTFWLALAVTSAVLWSVGEGPTVSQFFANLTMVPGPLGQTMVDSVYWTLALELKFYALMFAVLIFGHMRHIERYLTGWLVICLAGAMGLPVGPLTLAGYAPYFILGCLLYLLREGRSGRFYDLFAVAACLCVYQAVASPNATLFPDQPNMPYVAGLVVLGQISLFWLVAVGKVTIPPLKVWRILGAMTFPLYLMHNEIGEVLDTVLPGGEVFKLGVALTVSLALALAFAVTVELKAVPVLNRAMLKAWGKWAPRRFRPVAATT